MPARVLLVFFVTAIVVAAPLVSLINVLSSDSPAAVFGYIFLLPILIFGSIFAVVNIITLTRFLRREQLTTPLEIVTGAFVGLKWFTNRSSCFAVGETGWA